MCTPNQLFKALVYSITSLLQSDFVMPGVKFSLVDVYCLLQRYALFYLRYLLEARPPPELPTTIIHMTGHGQNITLILLYVCVRACMLAILPLMGLPSAAMAPSISVLICK